MKRLVAWAMACWMLPVAAPCHAASCTVSATALAFGTYVVTAPTPTTSTASVSIACQSNVSLTMSYSVSLSTGSSGSYSGRQMIGGGGSLGYQVYTGATQSQVWGDGTAGTGMPGDSYLLTLLTLITHSFTAYGSIPAQQNARPGSYTDTLTATITY